MERAEGRIKKVSTDFLDKGVEVPGIEGQLTKRLNSIAHREMGRMVEIYVEDSAVRLFSCRGHLYFANTKCYETRCANG